MQADEAILSHFSAYKSINVRKRLQYATFASFRRKYLFVETPKAACSTMKWLLAALEGVDVARKPIRPESTLAMCIHNRRLHPIKNIFHLSKQQAEHVLDGPDIVRFCVVRNPYARLVSAWSDKIRQLEPGYLPLCRTIMSASGSSMGRDALDVPSFAEFAGFVTRRHDPKNCNIHWHEMKSLLLPDGIAYTHVLKTESLAQDLEPVMARIAPEQDCKTILGAARTNESLPVAWKQQYDQRLADAVYEFYKDDFEYYQYDRNSWKPGAEDGSTGMTTGNLENRALMAIRSRNEVIDLLYEEIDALKDEIKRLTDPAKQPF